MKVKININENHNYFGEENNLNTSYEILNNRILFGRSGIHIKKSHKGQFTEYCGGKVTDAKIQAAKKSSNPKIRKQAVFAENARKWKHQNGGVLEFLGNGGTIKKFADGGSTSSNYSLPSSKLSDLFVTFTGTPSTFERIQSAVPLNDFDTASLIETPEKETKEEESQRTRLSSFGIYQNHNEQPGATQENTPSVTVELLSPTNARAGIYEDSETGRQKFVDDLDNALKKAGVSNKEIRTAIIAQNALESGWGAHSRGGGDYNYGNLTTGRYWTGNYRQAKDHDENGKWIIQNFRSYNSLDDYIADKLKFIGAGTRYNVDLNNDTASTYIDKMIAGHYATDPNYKNSLTQMLSSVRKRMS